ncbi:hypothetical protein PITC_010290 [Penicillium italicum]|uniref:Uncharacterized protein n=1 Tax=Penicillium italicum TaxID=40296 RepID=A0A0A2LCY2_PENIT|nr:hypothetical protein PITC_010290 [Penicillium italicum]
MKHRHSTETSLDICIDLSITSTQSTKYIMYCPGNADLVFCPLMTGIGK